MRDPREICIGNLRFDLKTRDLRDAAGNRVELRNKSSEVLATLAARPGQLATKADIMEAVWPEVTVSDENLTQCIADIRRAIGDKDQTLLKTHIGRGYSLDGATSSATTPSRRVFWASAGLVAVLLVLSFAWVFWPAPEPVGKPRIAVLAFDDLSAGADKGYLSDAIAEGIITELASFHELGVIARNSSFSFRDKDSDIQDIARELRADFVVEGSKQKSGERLRVTVQLIDGRDGTHIWADEFTDDIGELFAVQSRIVRGITTQIGREVVRKGPPKPDRDKVSALHYYQMGNQSFSERTRESRRAARDFYLRAIEAGPNAAYGHVGMAQVFWGDSSNRWVYSEVSREKILQRGAEHAEEALRIDPSYYAAHIARGDIHFIAGEQEEAIIRYQNAAELNPSSDIALTGPTMSLIFLNRSEEAVETMEKAIDINPITPGWYYQLLAFAKWGVADCAEGIQLMKKRSQLRPWDLRTLMVLQACNGDLEDAREAVAKHIEAEPDYTMRIYEDRNRETWNNPELLGRYLNDMRLAGMPEG